MPTGKENFQNQDLFNENKQGEYTYEQTQYGKMAEGYLKLEDGQRDANAQRNAGGAERRSNDDGGHYIGNRFNGDPGEKNLDAQDRNLNRGSYKIHENEMAKSIENGDKVFFHSEGFSANGNRPDAYMTYTITENQNGQRDIEYSSYTNESAKTQEQWNAEIENNPLMDEFQNPIEYDPSAYENELSDQSYEITSSQTFDTSEDHGSNNDEGMAM